MVLDNRYIRPFLFVNQSDSGDKDLSPWFALWVMCSLSYMPLLIYVIRNRFKHCILNTLTSISILFSLIFGCLVYTEINGIMYGWFYGMFSFIVLVFYWGCGVYKAVM